MLFEEIIKYYKRVFDKNIIDSIKKSLKFLTKYNNRIDVLIDTYKHDDEGELNSTQIRMLITNIKKFIFEKIFVNYFIDIISKYYDVSDMRVEIEELMHMLTFVEDDRREELLYSQKINILLEMYFSTLFLNKYKFSFLIKWIFLIKITFLFFEKLKLLSKQFSLKNLLINVVSLKLYL